MKPFVFNMIFNKLKATIRVKNKKRLLFIFNMIFNKLKATIRLKNQKQNLQLYCSRACYVELIYFYTILCDWQFNLLYDTILTKYDLITSYNTFKKKKFVMKYSTRILQFCKRDKYCIKEKKLKDNIKNTII